MPPYELELAIILRSISDDARLAEALFFPEVSRYGSDPETLKRAIIKNTVKIVETEDLNRLFTRTLPESIESFELNLHLEPPFKRSNWRNAFDLRFDVLRWKHGDYAYVAFVPALGIEIVSSKLDDLIPTNTAESGEISLLERHVRAELIRRGTTQNFQELISLGQTQTLSVMRLRSMATIRTPKQVMAGKPEEKKKSVLEEVALDLTWQKLAPAYEVEGTVAQLAEALTRKSALSVLLVGQSGAGKTAVFNELVRKRSDFGMGSIPFWATSGSRLVSGMTGYGMWQERCDAMWREAEQKNAVVHFGNLVELMDTGKSEHNAQGIASFFRQRFMRNQALAVVECTPLQLPLIEREDPALLKTFFQLTVAEPSPEAARKILAQYAEDFRIQSSSTSAKRRQQSRNTQAPFPTISSAGLDTLDRLHRRYAGYSAYPARPLRFLRGLLQDCDIAQIAEPSLGPREITDAFAKETGLPLFLLDDEVAFDGKQTVDWFGERVIGQQQAVSLIVDLLATVKAGLTRPRRPLASLLFAGPTGVGKTEMAKSLARFFFGDEERMTRFDMSEYADPLAVTRLAGSATGSEGTLTARIREQPFSVVLFDEFEKAHQSFFDLLLQILGEGRLTDGRGRLADFSNSLIIMTSNLGADRFRRSRPGFMDQSWTGGSDQADAEQKFTRAAQKHFTRAVQDFLRPEIFNRLDHIVPFLPLARETVERIAEREITLIRLRDGIRLRNVNLHVASAAIESLARRGYDTRYGARPLKRLIERELLLPLATALNSRPRAKKEAQLVAEVSVDGPRLRVVIEERPLDRKSQRVATTRYDASTQLALVARLEKSRRRVQLLNRSPAVIELYNLIWRLKETERRILKAARRTKTSYRQARTRLSLTNFISEEELARLPELGKVAHALQQLDEATASAEDLALLTLYSDVADGPMQDVALQIETDLQNVLSSLLDLRFARPNFITLGIFSENTNSLYELARAYFASAAAARMKITLGYYSANTRAKEPEKMFGRETARLVATKPAVFLGEAREGTTGMVFALEGRSAYARYASEHGLHAFVEEKMVHNLLVHTSELSLEKYKPPATLERRGAITTASHGERLRVYHRSEAYIEDRVLEQRREWRGSVEGIHGLAAALKEFIDLRHQLNAEELIVE